MKVSRATYRTLLQIDVLATTTLRLLHGLTPTDLESDLALQQAVQRQVSAITAAARRVQSSDASLLGAYAGDVAGLEHNPVEWDTLQAAIPRISAGVSTILREIEPPRWTPLGLRQRHRRQLGRD